MNLFADYEPWARSSERAGLPGGITIRPAEATDVQSVARLAHQRNGGELAAHLERFASWIEKSSQTTQQAIIVADLGGEVAGYGSIYLFLPPEDAPPDSAPAGWYLAGVIVDPCWRRRGIGKLLTEARLQWIANRNRYAHYFANALNLASIDLHREFGFEELTREFSYPGVSFKGGVGILFRADLARLDDIG